LLYIPFEFPKTGKAKFLFFLCHSHSLARIFSRVEHGKIYYHYHYYHHQPTEHRDFSRSRKSLSNAKSMGDIDTLPYKFIYIHERNEQKVMTLTSVRWVWERDGGVQAAVKATYIYRLKRAKNN
jgi:hypothetical protein